VPVVEHLVRSVGRLASHHIEQVGTQRTSVAEGLVVRGNPRELTQVLLNPIITASQSLAKETSPEEHWMDVGAELPGKQVVTS